jgi:hypothetical protein
MQQTIQLIDKALTKANNDLNNESIEVNYTPEFLIELLTELKETLNAKPKGDVYEIRKEYSNILGDYRFYIYENNWFKTSATTMQDAYNLLDKMKNTPKSQVLHREEVINE